MDVGGLLASAGCAGSLHAVRLGDGVEIGYEPDRAWVMASVVKVPIGLSFYVRVSRGEIDPAEQVTLPPGHVTPGPVGISRFSHPVTVSLADLAYLMLTISDNAATDVVTRAVGLDAVNDDLGRLGCQSTRVVSDLHTMLDSVAAELGFSDYSELLVRPAGSAGTTSAGSIGRCRPDRRLSGARSATASDTTARDATRLLTAVWTDDSDAGATLRSVMAEQVTRRLGPAVPDGGSLAAKSGALFGRIRNEIGVVTDPDGVRYAVAVFTRAAQPFQRQNEINRAMGNAVKTALDELRDR